MARFSTAVFVCCTIALLALCPVWASVGTQGAWNQIHHDTHNSGRVPFATSLANGKCLKWARYANQTFGDEVIQANGVMGVTGDNYFFVGCVAANECVVADAANSTVSMMPTAMPPRRTWCTKLTP